MNKNKDEFIKKLTLILKDFDSNREADMKYFLDDICYASEIYFVNIIKEEIEKSIKEFIVE